MGRPTIMRSVKRQRVEAAELDAAEAGHDFLPSSDFFGPVKPEDVDTNPDGTDAIPYKEPRKRRWEKPPTEAAEGETEGETKPDKPRDPKEPREKSNTLSAKRAAVAVKPAKKATAKKVTKK